MQPENYLTVTEAAARLKIHPETVRVWLREGRLGGTLLGGKRAGWRIPESEVERILRGGARRPPDEEAEPGRARVPLAVSG